MDEASITLKGKALRNFSKINVRFDELGFSTIAVENKKIMLEKIETADLKGNVHHFYRITFLPDQLIFTYSLGQDRKRREFEAFFTLLNILKISEDFYEVKTKELYTPLLSIFNEMRAIMESEGYSTTQKNIELQEKYASLEKKYKDLVLSSEQNARILLECEKKRDNYHARIKQLEGINDEMLTQEIFKWLKTHCGEMNISQFAKSYGIPFARVEERLEYLLKNGYIRQNR
ncbi:MAG: hypothetical protein AB1391_01935 [Candidatus Micrarchaeota archaeon]